MTNARQHLLCPLRAQRLFEQAASKIDAATGRQVGRSVVLVQWQEGGKTVVWPAEQRQTALVYPWGLKTP